MTLNPITEQEIKSFQQQLTLNGDAKNLVASAVQVPDSEKLNIFVHVLVVASQFVNSLPPEKN
jgi:predicted metal-dependent TIM-barrel fold hydrolase